LVAGAFSLGDLRAGVGFALLGVALAWAIGSDNRVAHWLFVVIGVAGVLSAAVPPALVWNTIRVEEKSYRRQVAAIESSLPELARNYPLRFKQAAEPHLTGIYRVASTGKYWRYTPEDGWAEVQQPAASASRGNTQQCLAQIDGGWIPITLSECERLATWATDEPIGPLGLAAQTKRYEHGRWIAMPSWYWDALAAGVDVGDVPDYLKPGEAPGSFWSRYEPFEILWALPGLFVLGIGLALLLTVKSNDRLAECVPQVRSETRT